MTISTQSSLSCGMNNAAGNNAAGNIVFCMYKQPCDAPI